MLAVSPQRPERAQLEKLLWFTCLSKGRTQDWPRGPWPQSYLGDEQWSGIVLPSLAASWLLWARAQLWLNQFTIGVCLGTFTPVLILLEAFLTESYFIFLVRLEFCTPRKTEVSKVWIFIHTAASRFSLRSVGTFRIFLDMWLHVGRWCRW